MTGKARFGFRIPKQVRRTPFLPTPGSIQYLGGLTHMQTHVPPTLCKNSHLMAILGPRGTQPAVKFVIHQRVCSDERPKEDPGLGRKLQGLRFDVEPGIWPWGESTNQVLQTSHLG